MLKRLVLTRFPGLRRLALRPFVRALFAVTRRNADSKTHCHVEPPISLQCSRWPRCTRWMPQSTFLCCRGDPAHVRESSQLGAIEQILAAEEVHRCLTSTCVGCRFRLRGHRFATVAARAAECAAEQDRVEAMHDVLYAAQDSFGLVPWSCSPLRPEFPTNLASPSASSVLRPWAALAHDTLDGKRLGVTGTPTLLINDLRVEGSPPLDSLESYIERAKVAALTSLKDRTP